MAKTEPNTTEVILRDGSKDVVTIDFADTYPALAPDEETLELLEENLGSEGENIGIGNFKRVKVPSSESDAWMLLRGGKQVAEEKIRGIVVAWKARRSFWMNGEPDGSQPDCSSLDNRHPVPGGLFHPTGERGNQNPTGKCVNCPMAQFGSDPKGGRGAACKEQRLLFLVVPDALFPIVLHVPRTSIKEVTSFMLDLMDSRKKYYEVEVELALVKDKNKGGQAYNKIKMSRVRDLEPGESTATKVYGAQIKAMIEQMVATFDVEPEADGGYSVAQEQPA